MSDVFNKAFEEQPTEAKGEVQQQEPAAAPVAAAPAEGNDAPPASKDTEKTGLLKALDAERTGRQDWKEKAIRFEEELKALRNQGQQQQPRGEVDPLQAQIERFENVTLNASERNAISVHGKEVVDKAFERYQAEVAKNPALAMQVRNSGDPWDELVKVGKRLMALDEIGEDPSAFRTKLRAEVEAEIRASLQPQKPEQQLPASLAGARSAGSRGATWTGPTPLGSIL